MSTQESNKVDDEWQERYSKIVRVSNKWLSEKYR